LFAEYQGNDLGARAWMRRWFESRRFKYQREKPGELAEPMGMILAAVAGARMVSCSHER
jgi:hypothetical protein